MIKRRFYKHEHDDKNDPSDSSSSSDSELEAEDVDESDDDAVTGVEENVESQQSEDDDAVAEAKEDAESEESDDDDAAAEVKVDTESCSTSSGYQSEDVLAHEVDAADSSGELVNEDDEETTERDSVLVDVPPYILQHKKVFRCRICPRVVCLSQDFLTAHLKSKKHARAEKLLNEGRLKSILNDNLEVENQETPAELHARIVALAQSNPKNKNKGRQRQKKRKKEMLSRKKTGHDSNLDKARISTKSRAKKRRKNDK